MAGSSSSYHRVDAQQLATLLHAVVRRLDALDTRLDSVPTVEALENVAVRIERRCEQVVAEAMAASRQTQPSHGLCEATLEETQQLNTKPMLSEDYRRLRTCIGRFATSLIILAIFNQWSRRRLNRAVRRLPLRMLLLIQVLSVVILSASSAVDFFREKLARIPIFGALLLGRDPMPLLSEHGRWYTIAFARLTAMVIPWKLGLELSR